MKRLFLCLLIFGGLVVPLAPAATAEILKLPCGIDGATYSVQLPEGIAQDGNKCSGALVIDSRVKVLDQAAFQGSQLTSVTIPNSVTSTGEWTFNNTPLTSVTIPNSVTDIGGFSFAQTRLTSVTIPNSVTSIGSSAFADAPLASVIIPNSVKDIGPHAFIKTKLTSVIIPNSVTSIGIGAFYKVPLTSVTISNSLKNIDSGTFMNTRLTSVTIPNSVTTIGSQAFYKAPLASVDIPNSVSSIGIGAFAETQLTTVTIPNSVRVIGYFAFANISPLATVTVPEKILVLDSNVFDRDNSLTKITYCGSLSSFPIKATCPPERAAALAADKAAADRAAAAQVVADRAAADRAAAAAKILAGSKCNKLRKSAIFGNYKYTCIKSGKKLVWSKGVALGKPTPKPTSIPTSKPTSRPNPMPSPAELTLIFPPDASVSAITLPPLSMKDINTQQFLWGGGMDPAFVTLGPKLGLRGDSGAYFAKSGVNYEIGAGVPILAPINSRFIGFNDRNSDYTIGRGEKSVVEGALNTPYDDLELCFESTSSDWPGLIYCFYHLGNTPLLLGINIEPSCSNAKEWPGTLRAEGWQFFTEDNYVNVGNSISASCGALLGREVKRGDVIAYSGTTGPFSQAPIKMKVPNRAINPTVKKTGNLNLHWVQGDAFFYWKCYAPDATFEQGVLAYPWECGGYKIPKEQNSTQFKYRK